MTMTRSLMQGDYMTLRFSLGNDIQHARNTDEGTARNAVDGYVVIRLNENKVGSFLGLTSEYESVKDEQRLYYRVRNGRVKFTTNAFFFQEGHAERYEPARYGKFRVNSKAQPLLVALYDNDLKELGRSAP